MVKKIYIVEDDAIIALSYKKNFEREGFQVAGLASSGEKALIEIENAKPDIVGHWINLDARILECKFSKYFSF